MIKGNNDMDWKKIDEFMNQMTQYRVPAERKKHGYKPYGVGLHEGPCTCPECGEPMGVEPRYRECTCPTMIYIQPGHHIHVDCPRHGRTRINGSQITWC